MKFDKEMIQHLQALARIELSPEEEEKLGEQLARIVTHCEQLQEVDTEGVEPTSAVVHEEEAGLRADEVGPSLDRKAVLAEAPDSDAFGGPCTSATLRRRSALRKAVYYGLTEDPRSFPQGPGEGIVNARAIGIWLRPANS